MPIDIERFESGEDFREQPTSLRIVRFLLANDDRAYTRSEIADAIDATPETVGTNLTRLKDRGVVRHREPYWAFAQDRERALAALRARYDEAHLADVFDEMVEEDSPQESMESIASTHRAAATAFFERVRDELDDVIESLYLFGSVARRAATTDSDVDLLAIIADDAEYAVVDDQLLDIAYDVQLELDTRIEVHSIRASEFERRKKRGDPFVQTVLEEGDAGV